MSASSSPPFAQELSSGVASYSGTDLPDQFIAKRSSVFTLPASPGLSNANLDLPYQWPTGKPVPVVKLFQAPLTKYGAGHRGIDLRYPSGSPVYAAQNGYVYFVGEVAGIATISVMHPDGIRTTYQPVLSSLTKGTQVIRGTQIGTLLPDKSGGLLQFGAKIDKYRYLNPFLLIYGPIRLLPK